jgi:lysophospholipase
MARHEEGFFTSPDGLRLFWESDTPDAPRAYVGLVHGYADHCGRYRNTIDDLVRDGFAVHAFDYRGHGQSDGRRGHCDKWGEYLSDLRSFYGRMAEAAKGKPIFLLGHSHGGLMVARLLADAPKDLKGAILSSPYLKLALTPPAWKTAAARIVSRIIPWLPFKNEIDPEQLSRDPKVHAAVKADRLYNLTVSPRWFTEANQAQGEAMAAASAIKAPLFVYCGSEDPIASASQTRGFFEKVGSADKRFREYPGMRHEPLNELGRDEVVRDIVGWISAHL